MFLKFGKRKLTTKKMNSKLYYIAYKFLKIRATQGNPFKVVEQLTKENKETVFKFLSYNHNVKFI